MDRLRGRRILVVEDEGLVAMMVEDTLVDDGATVLGPVGTVAEALALLENGAAPDAAVLDLNLAGESSMPVADRLVELGVPFVVASGYGASGLAKRHAAVPVLSKPYDLNELPLALARVCRRAHPS